MSYRSRQSDHVGFESLESLVDASDVADFLSVFASATFIANWSAAHGTGGKRRHTSVTPFTESRIRRLIAAGVFFYP